MGFYNCFMFCCALLNAHSNFEIILMGKSELVALVRLSSWCLMIVVWPFLVVSWGCLHLVIVVFPDHTHYFFLSHYLAEHASFKIGITNWEMCLSKKESNDQESI